MNAAHLPPLFLGLFSFSLSNSAAKLNCLAAFFIAGLPSSRIPLGNLPSGDMFLILRMISYSSLRVLNILLIFATDCTFDLIFNNFFFLVSAVCSFTIFEISTFSSSTSVHFFTIVYNMLLTFSARKGNDHENTFSPSGNL